MAAPTLQDFEDRFPATDKRYRAFDGIGDGVIRGEILVAHAVVSELRPAMPEVLEQAATLELAAHLLTGEGQQTGFQENVSLGASGERNAQGVILGSPLATTVYGRAYQILTRGRKRLADSPMAGRIGFAC